MEIQSPSTATRRHHAHMVSMCERCWMRWIASRRTPSTVMNRHSAATTLIENS